MKEMNDPTILLIVSVVCLALCIVWFWVGRLVERRRWQTWLSQTHRPGLDTARSRILTREDRAS